jgi:hypothetical protein
VVLSKEGMDLRAREVVGFDSHGRQGRLGRAVRWVRGCKVRSCSLVEIWCFGFVSDLGFGACPFS